jgi:AcrR family transcriptional regulator
MRPPKTATRKRRSSRDTARAARQPLGREDWIAAARAELIAGGLNAVKIERLAGRLRVTRGSFYWHFTSHADLLRDLLSSWEQTNTNPFEQALVHDGTRHGMKEFLTIINLWLEEKDYSPAFDTAVRDWARTSREATAAVRRADERRIEVLHRVFIDMGFLDPDALIRARITYFHQVGYYALEIRENPERRRALVPLYCQVLLGKPNELINAAYVAANSREARVAAAESAAPAASAVATSAPAKPVSR